MCYSTLIRNTNVKKIDDDSKADFILNFIHIEILEMYNSNNDINSLLLIRTEGQTPALDQN